MPLLSCSSGLILSEVEIIDKKFDPLISLEELIYKVILLANCSLNSSNVVLISNGLIH